MGNEEREEDLFSRGQILVATREKRVSLVRGWIHARDRDDRAWGYDSLPFPKYLQISQIPQVPK